jgi:hypothetical protein
VLAPRLRPKNGDKSWRKSRSFAVVIPQHAAESLAAPDLTRSVADFVARFNQAVVEPLMMTFRMKVSVRLSFLTLRGKGPASGIRGLPVNRRKQRSLQLFAARLSFFTSRLLINVLQLAA